MSDGNCFAYGGRNFRVDSAWGGSSRVQVWVRCQHHPDHSISLGSVGAWRPGLGQALFRKVKRGLRTRKRCYECKQDEGMVERAYSALKPLLQSDERVAS